MACDVQFDEMVEQRGRWWIPRTIDRMSALCQKLPSTNCYSVCPSAVAIRRLGTSRRVGRIRA